MEPIGLIFCMLFKKMGMTPNFVSILSLIAGFIGGVLFYWNDFWLNLAGVLLIILSMIWDCTDGQLARLTHKTSVIGRLLDGIATVACYVAAYIALGLRMQHECIPFTDTLWGGWVWAMIVPIGLICHAGQDRMADYYRNLHLLFFTRGDGSEFDRSKALYEQFRTEKESVFKRFYLFMYANYTKMQEQYSPRLQKFLAVAGDDGKYPEPVRECFLTESRKYIQLTNLLTINFRAIVMFLLVLIGQYAFYFPFLVLMELINIYMIVRYEKIAAKLKNDFYR